MDLGDLRLLDAAADGQQAACLGDFNGDGAQDMVLALKDGEAWLFPRLVEGGGALSVSVTLSPGKGLPEPVNVTGWAGSRCLGSQRLTSGGPPAFFGRLEAGPVTLKWSRPDGTAQSKEVVVIDKPVHVALPMK